MQPGDPTWAHQLLDLAMHVEAWSGNHCDMLEYGESEYAHLRSQGERIVEEVRDEALVITGRSPRDLIGGPHP